MLENLKLAMGNKPEDILEKIERLKENLEEKESVNLLHELLGNPSAVTAAALLSIAHLYDLFGKAIFEQNDELADFILFQNIPQAIKDWHRIFRSDIEFWQENQSLLEKRFGRMHDMLAGPKNLEDYNRRDHRRKNSSPDA